MNLSVKGKLINFSAIQRLSMEKVVSAVVNDLMNAIVHQAEDVLVQDSGESTEQKKAMKKQMRCGSVKRKQYTAAFKANVPAPRCAVETC